MKEKYIEIKRVEKNVKKNEGIMKTGEKRQNVEVRMT